MKKLITLILLFVCCNSIFGVQLDENMKIAGWNLIRSRFLYEDNRLEIYQKDIAIKLAGKVSSADSTCANELIYQLKTIIPNRKIYLTSANENLIFIFSDKPFPENLKSRQTVGPGIVRTENYMVFSSDITKESRKKDLYSRLYRSLVSEAYRGNTPEFKVLGSAFCEDIPENITYHPVDSFVVSKLYADDFLVQLENLPNTDNLFLSFFAIKYHNELNLGFFFLGLLFSILLLSVLIIKGVFKSHNWRWLEYCKQGLFLILIGGIFAFCILLSDLKLDSLDFQKILSYFLRSLFLINVIYTVERLIFKNRDLGGSKIILIFFITFILLMVFSFPSRSWYSWSATLNVLIKDTYTYLLPYLFVIALGRSLFIFLNDRYNGIINHKDMELARMNELHKQAELQSLRAKINPHFLYNALNSIASLATTDARKTEQMALALSDFFKYAINREQKQLNSLSEELNAVRTYLEIEKVRFGDRLSFKIDCPEELLNIQIPQLLIQPLVENAIKHGLSQITESGLIRISVSKEENKLKVRVYDNGPAFLEGPLTGFGIQNTQERIALLYGAKATINWQNGEDKYIEISLPLEQTNIGK